MNAAPPIAGNPWFRQWPRDARGNPLAQGTPKASPMKPLPQFLREGNYPPRFVQIIPFQFQPVTPGQTQSFAIKLDADFPFRMDALVFQLGGMASAEAFGQILVDLPSGRRLTRNPVDPWAFNGTQGGRDFVPFRHRFSPADTIVLSCTCRADAPASLTARGFVFGYKLTQESRL